MVVSFYKTGMPSKIGLNNQLRKGLSEGAVQRPCLPTLKTEAKFMDAKSDQLMWLYSGLMGQFAALI